MKSFELAWNRFNLRDPLMRSFQWNAVTYPIPDAWVGLDLDSWLKRMVLVHHGMHLVELRQQVSGDKATAGRQAPHLQKFLRQRAGFHSQEHFEAFQSWGIQFWASHTGTPEAELSNRLRNLVQARIAGAVSPAVSRLNPALERRVPFERWIEIQEALSAALERGDEVDAVLAQFVLTPSEWSEVARYWSHRFQSEAHRYLALFDHLKPLFYAKYRRKRSSDAG